MAGRHGGHAVHLLPGRGESLSLWQSWIQLGCLAGQPGAGRCGHGQRGHGLAAPTYIVTSSNCSLGSCTNLCSDCNSLLLRALQQAGGKTLDAPAVEITYGMERILMALQVWHSRRWVDRLFAEGACGMCVSPILSHYFWHPLLAQLTRWSLCSVVTYSWSLLIRVGAGCDQLP